MGSRGSFVCGQINGQGDVCSQESNTIVDFLTPVVAVTKVGMFTG